MCYGLTRARSNVLPTLCLAFAALVLLAPCGVKAQGTVWTVTADVSSGAQTPVYTVSRAGGSCPFPAPTDAYFLTICAGDSVVWNARTSSTKYSLQILFPRPVLNDASSTLTKLFTVSNGTTTGGATNASVTGANGNPHVEYEYIVSIYDTVNNKAYIDDPKIIVGTGTGTAAVQLVNTIDLASGQLDSSLQDSSDKRVKDALNRLNQAILDLKKALGLAK